MIFIASKTLKKKQINKQPKNPKYIFSKENKSEKEPKLSFQEFYKIFHMLLPAF